MFKLALVSALLVAVYGLPYDAVRTGETVARIIAQDSDIKPDGSYQWNYETENGIAAQETGVQKPSADGLATAAQGSYRYTAPSGEPIEIRYIADDEGFRAEGNAIPQSPPIPALILRALEWNAAHPEVEQRQVIQPVNKYYQ